MIHTGLVSVTFRKLPPTEIIALAAKAGLEGIEWGGDIHVPHGDLEIARKVRQLTRAAGLKIFAYGSYYKAGLSETEGLSFEKVLTSAMELQAPTIRVWAGKEDSDKAAPEYRQRVVADLRRIADRAAAEKISVSLEYHGRTLNDHREASLRLFAELNHSNLFTYWQPPVSLAEADCLAALQAVLPKLTHLHVYHWDRETRKRLFLAEGRESWKKYFGQAAGTGREHAALLEFVKEDQPDNFLKDAASLRELVKGGNR